MIQARRLGTLVGSPTGHLLGAARDLERTSGVLEARFRFQVSVSPRATRAEICAALDQLTRDVQPSDSVVAYFTGHGGVGRFVDGLTDRDPSVEHRYLVPIDHPPPPEDSRGSRGGVSRGPRPRVGTRLS